jgi:hypothetical protein
MNSAVVELATDSGPLLRVSGKLVPPDRFREIAFEFGSGTLILRCDDDTDEIILEVRTPQAPSSPSGDPVLSELLGMRIDYAWELRNHRGYTDAVQLRLVDATGREETRQFEVAASALDMRRVTP